jgi:DnaK suppressor protein
MMDPVERLGAERARMTHQLAQLRRDFDAMVEAALDSNADDEHDPEGATIAFERSQIDTLIRQTEGHLLEIDRALSRLGDETYGICQSCGGAIPAARLDARPTARTCVSC